MTAKIRVCEACRATIPARLPCRAGLRRHQPGLRMSASDRTVPSPPSGRWIANQPYLLLCITALCWAGNAIVGRLAAGHIAPVTLSFLRWSLAFLIILPFAWKHLVRDWAAIRCQLGIMILLSVTGIGAFNTMQYWALEHTQAINTLLLQSAGAAVRRGVVAAAARRPADAGAGRRHPAVADRRAGDHAAWRLARRLKNIDFNSGDLIFLLALFIFGLYSVMSLKRPQIHGLSFVGFTFGCGAACLIPLFIWELLTAAVHADRYAPTC